VINIKLVLDEAGLLKSCDIQGHAGAGKRGNDIVCAAVSVLARTALTVLSGREGIVVKGSAPQRGEFKLETEALNNEGRDFLNAAGSFLIEGLESVAGEYPHYCVMTVSRERRN